jgi:hypothetical protein
MHTPFYVERMSSAVTNKLVYNMLDRKARAIPYIGKLIFSSSEIKT